MGDLKKVGQAVLPFAGAALGLPTWAGPLLSGTMGGYTGQNQGIPGAVGGGAGGLVGQQLAEAVGLPGWVGGAAGGYFGGQHGDQIMGVGDDMLRAIGPAYFANMLAQKEAKPYQDMYDQSMGQMHGAASGLMGLHQNVLGGGWDWGQPTQQIDGQYSPSEEGIDPYTQSLRMLSHGMIDPMSEAERSARTGAYIDGITRQFEQMGQQLVEQAVARGQSPDPNMNPALARSLQEIDSQKQLAVQSAQRDVMMQGEDLKRQNTQQLLSALNPAFQAPGMAAGIYGQTLGPTSDMINNIYGTYGNMAGAVGGILAGEQNIGPEGWQEHLSMIYPEGIPQQSGVSITEPGGVPSTQDNPYGPPVPPYMPGGAPSIADQPYGPPAPQPVQHTGAPIQPIPGTGAAPVQNMYSGQAPQFQPQEPIQQLPGLTIGPQQLIQRQLPRQAVGGFGQTPVGDLRVGTDNLGGSYNQRNIPIGDLRGKLGQTLNQAVGKLGQTLNQAVGGFGQTPVGDLRVGTDNLGGSYNQQSPRSSMGRPTNPTGTTLASRMDTTAKQRNIPRRS